MFKGIIYALSACFIWGLIFVVPLFMTNFTSIEIVVVRYLFYGALSLLIFLKARLMGTCSYAWSVWIKALCLSFLAGYYLWVVLGVRYASPEVCALIAGISPISIAFYGNWKQKEGQTKRLILPSLFILIGLIMINATRLEVIESTWEYAFGLVCSFIALFSWTGYVVLNSRYLKNNTHVSSNDWATIQGIAIFFWVVVFCLSWVVFFGGRIDTQRYFVWNHETINFFVGSAILGWLCSWVGGFLWNKASIKLPVSLAGQLMIFETIFGVIFVYILNQQLPTLLEFSGIILLLGAVIYGIRSFTAEPHHT